MQKNKYISLYKWKLKIIIKEKELTTKKKNTLKNNDENIDSIIKIEKLPKINYYNFINDDFENNGPRETYKKYLYINNSNNLINIILQNRKI